MVSSLLAERLVIHDQYALLREPYVNNTSRGAKNYLIQLQNIERENFDNGALIRQIRQNFPRQTFAPYGMCIHVHKHAHNHT